MNNLKQVTLKNSKNLAISLMAFACFIGAPKALASSPIYIAPGEEKRVIVTNITTCRYLNDDRKDKRAYLGVYVSPVNEEYHPKTSQRLYFWFDSCDGKVELAQKLLRTYVHFAADRSSYSDHWDNDIANGSLKDYVDRSQQNVTYAFSGLNYDLFLKLQKVHQYSENGNTHLIFISEDTKTLMRVELLGEGRPGIVVVQDFLTKKIILSQRFFHDNKIALENAFKNKNMNSFRAQVDQSTQRLVYLHSFQD